MENWTEKQRRRLRDKFNAIAETHQKLFCVECGIEMKREYKNGTMAIPVCQDCRDKDKPGGEFWQESWGSEWSLFTN